MTAYSMMFWWKIGLDLVIAGILCAGSALALYLVGEAPAGIDESGDNRTESEAADEF